MIVDEMHHEHPELVKDQYWDEKFPIELPYTLAAEPYRDFEPVPSTANLQIPKAATMIFNAPSTVKIDEMNADGFVSTFFLFKKPIIFQYSIFVGKL